MNSKLLQYRGLLTARLVLVDAMWLGGVVYATLKGWPQMVWEADISRVSSAIAVILAVALGSAMWRGWQIGGTLDNARALGAARGSVAHYKRKLRSLHYTANSLTLVGLIGTVVGFIIALSGVDQQAIGNPNAIGPIVAQLMAGMGVAMYTTLVGALASVWLTMNLRLLDDAVEKLGEL